MQSAILVSKRKARKVGLDLDQPTVASSVLEKGLKLGIGPVDRRMCYTVYAMTK